MPVEEADIIELEKKYWVLQAQSKSGRFDLDTFMPLISPPMPIDLCEGKGFFICIHLHLFVCSWKSSHSHLTKAVYSDYLQRESNFLASTRPVTALCVYVCCIVCVCDCVMVIREPTRK